jgi:hypothetical protein
VHAAEVNIQEEVAIIQQLSQVASKYPYYRFNYSWQRQIESSVLQQPDPSSARAPR